MATRRKLVNIQSLKLEQNRFDMIAKYPKLWSNASNVTIRSKNSSFVFYFFFPLRHVHMCIEHQYNKLYNLYVI